MKTMRNHRQIVMILGILLTFSMVIGAGSAYAYKEPKKYDLWNKLGRGVGNIVACPMELLNQPSQMYKDGERLLPAIVGGLGKGVVYTATRAVVGVYEVATFPLPLPEGYKPIMEPEFAFPEE
ncbi:MAG: exosortase system-associated protein, TIGR04073 family [Candidatus Omnitrophica bacterium]|nr:exosortase system-associated protein, TIGR04073 family [Candidatus Omnitrophota bacterium]